MRKYSRALPENCRRTTRSPSGTAALPAIASDRPVSTWRAAADLERRYIHIAMTRATSAKPMPPWLTNFQARFCVRRPSSVAATIASPNLPAALPSGR